MNQRLGRAVHNRFKVPLKQWNKWTNHAKNVFNKLYHEMRPSNQWAFSHPKMLPMPKEYWDVLRWNAAFTAAHIATGLKHFTGFKGAPNIHAEPKKRAKKRVTQKRAERAVRQLMESRRGKK